MNTQVAVLAVVTVLLHVPAGRGFSVSSQNSEHRLDAGDGTGMKQVSGESDVSNQDLDASNLMLVKESVGNDLHDVRKREARSGKRSRKRQGEPGDESGMDKKHESNEKVLPKGIPGFLESQKEKIIEFMKPILDRIQHKPKKPKVGNSSESATSPALSTPAPSNSSDPYASSSPEPDTSSSFNSSVSNSSDSDASNSTNSDASTPSNSYDNNFSFFPVSSSKCGENDRERSMSALSLLFPDLQSNKSEQPFVFLPLTNTLMRVVEQQMIGESQSGGDPKRKLHN